MREFARRLSVLNQKWGYELATCGEKIDLTEFGVKKNHCVDDELIIKLAYDDKKLMDYLKVKFYPMPQKAYLETLSLYQIVLSYFLMECMHFMETTRTKAKEHFVVV